MSGHTPGPWVVLGTHRYKGVADIGGYKGELVAEVACPSVERRNANAHLIAAAPRMREYIAHKAAEGDEEAIALLEAVDG